MYVPHLARVSSAGSTRLYLRPVLPSLCAYTFGSTKVYLTLDPTSGSAGPTVAKKWVFPYLAPSTRRRGGDESERSIRCLHVFPTSNQRSPSIRMPCSLVDLSAFIHFRWKDLRMFFRVRATISVSIMSRRTLFRTNEATVGKGEGTGVLNFHARPYSRMTNILDPGIPTMLGRSTSLAPTAKRR